MLAAAFVLISVTLSVNAVLRTSFVKLQSSDLASVDSNTLLNLGIVGSNIECSCMCSSKGDCVGFYFNEADGTCWGANTGQTAANTMSFYKDCGTPPAIINAVLSAGDTHVGETSTYSCSPGYVLRNVVTVDTTCQSDGSWSTPSFDCLLDCGVPPTFQNAQVLAGDSHAGETRIYSCSPGYVLINVVTLDTTCQSDGKWSTPPFDCWWDCGTPPVMPYGRVSAGDSVKGSTRSYTCDYGYGTTGTATITCQEGTGWSAPTSSCTELLCDFGWHKIGLSCYYYPGDGTGFKSDVFTARDLCHTYGAYLVQLETESESNAVVSWFVGAYPGIEVWIGLSDVDVEGMWVWMNSLVPATWTDWDITQPNEGTSGNNCVLGTNGNWYDRRWDESKQPLCEKSVQ